VKKNWVHFIDVKKMHPDLPYRPIRTTTFVHGVLLSMHKMTPNFSSMWAFSGQASMQNLTEFGHQKHVASRSAIVFGFFIEKTLENA
jgi:hypothetical protein